MLSKSDSITNLFHLISFLTPHVCLIIHIHPHSDIWTKSGLLHLRSRVGAALNVNSKSAGEMSVRLRGGPLMILGGGRLGQKWEKKSTATRPGKNLNSTTQKNSSACWPGKKNLISWLARKKNSTRILCPRPPQIINGLPLNKNTSGFGHWEIRTLTKKVAGYHIQILQKYG